MKDITRSAALSVLPAQDPAAIADIKRAAKGDDREFGVCIGKQTFANAAAAMEQSIWINKTDPGVQHYKCRYCSGWHVGNRTSRKKRIGVRR